MQEPGETRSRIADRAAGRRRAAVGLLLAGSLLSGAAAAVEPGGIYTVRPGETLSRIAAEAYGDGGDWPAIMLATNDRLTQQPELRFISDPNQVEPGERVWVPSIEEMERWMDQYGAYVAAVLDMSLPQPWEVSTALVPLADGRPLRMVTWARSGQFQECKAPPEARGADCKTTTDGEVWVTAVPYLQRFCQALPAGTDLVLRLEQRLGMPPASNKTEFVEIVVLDPARDLFRPCADTRIDTTTCALGPPGADASEEDRDWFLNQYFVSYATAHPTRYPWTSLGYTYDWGGAGSEEGESEFVVREGAEIEVAAITPTAEYCGR